MGTFDRRPVVKCLVGSHNYNLAEEGSDRDYKVFVLPTFDDLYRGNTYSKSIIGDAEDWDVHDVRKVVHLWWKANLNFIEVLYSTDVQFLSDAPELKRIWDMRDRIVRMNLPYLYKACEGMYYNKMKYLEKGTEGTQHLVERYGWDTKQGMHAYRILDFVMRFAQTDFDDFQRAMTYVNVARQFPLAIKHGAYDLTSFRDLVDEKYEQFKEYAPIYITQRPDEETKRELDELVYALVKRSI